MKYLLRLTLLSLALTGNLQADDSVSEQAPAIAAIRAALAQIIPDQKPDSIVSSPVHGLFEVSYGTSVYYVSQDGRFLLRGDLLDLNTEVNLTEQKRAQGRLKLLKTIDPDSAIVFSPAEKRYTVTVFTDIDCDFCRKMHRNIKSYTDRGIEIRYLAYPRSGPNTRSYFKAVSVWCSADRATALTIAKSGANFDLQTCADHPVDKHMALADKLGVSGTPALLFDDGSLIPGYVPADTLSQFLAAGHVGN